MAKLYFQQALLQSHNPSESILILRFAAQETFRIVINVKNRCAVCTIVVETIHSGFFNVKKVQRNSIYQNQNELYCRYVYT